MSLTSPRDQWVNVQIMNCHDIWPWPHTLFGITFPKIRIGKLETEPENQSLFMTSIIGDCLCVTGVFWRKLTMLSWNHTLLFIQSSMISLERFPLLKAAIKNAVTYCPLAADAFNLKIMLNDNFCKHIMFIFCEISLGWMSIISS